MRNSPTHGPARGPAHGPALALLALGIGALLLLASPGAWRIVADPPEAGLEPWAQILESSDAVRVAGSAGPRAPR